jgi:repressor LexA
MTEAELQRIVDYIEGFTAAHGFAPSYAEIAEGCGLGSVGHVQYRINRLIREGRVARTPGRARSLRVAAAAKGSEQNRIKSWFAAVRKLLPAFARRRLTPK